jgi:uncharacterized delta-60 repeat protein
MQFALDAFAAPGDFDPAFGTNGQAINTIPGAYSAVVPAIQADGKIVLATSFVNSFSNLDFAVMRLKANGTADTEFGTNGRVIIPFDDFFDEEATAVAVAPDGKIVVVGHVQLGSPGYDFGIARLNPNGSLDTTFDGDGKLKIPVSNSNDFPYDVAVQTDGKIIIAGKGFNQPNSDLSFVRLNVDGSPDATFNGTGKLIVPLGSNDSIAEIAVQPDGKIVAAGTDGADFAVVRLTSMGMLDASFNGTGIATTPIGTQRDEAFSVALQADGKILVAGAANSGSFDEAAIVRYNANGTPDASFDGDGKVTIDFQPTFSEQFRSVLVQTDGKILGVAVGAGKFNLVRYNPNGTPDATFGTNGVKIATVDNGQNGPSKAVLQADGKLVASGLTASGFAVARFLTGFGRTFADFDGDNKTDVGIFRPSDGSWWYARSSSTDFRVYSFGASTDIITPGDYTGDGKTDLAVFRPATGEWFVQRSEDNSYFSFPFGQSGDVPVPADYDADGKTDAAIFRPSTGTWYVLNSGGSGTGIVSFGGAGDKPVVADYDGDGKADIAIFRPSDGSWWYLRSIDLHYRVYTFGTGADIPVPGDYSGDGKAELAVFRPSSGEWFFQRSENNSYYSLPFGAGTDVPAPGDYDGDGRFDTAVFRPSTGEWFIERSSAGTLITNFGGGGDRPIANAFVP